MARAVLESLGFQEAITAVIVHDAITLGPGTSGAAMDMAGVPLAASPP